MAQPFCWKKIWQLLIKLTINLPYDSAIQPLVIYPREMKAHMFTPKTTYTRNVHSSFLQNSPNCKQPINREVDKLI
jgi:hypothetical protein